MKHSVLHRSLSAGLALLVLLSTISFTVNKHYCGGHLIDSAILLQAEKCGGMGTETDGFMKKPCCEDTVDVIEGQDELQHSDIIDLSIKEVNLIKAFCFSYSLFYESLPNPVVPNPNYAPPNNLPKDIQIAFQRFLI